MKKSKMRSYRIKCVVTALCLAFNFHDPDCLSFAFIVVQ